MLRTLRAVQCFALGPDEYLEQLSKIKAAVRVPVIASLNAIRDPVYSAAWPMHMPGGAKLAMPSTTDTARGLTSQEAELRLTQFGENDPLPRRKRNALRDFLGRFTNPLVAILLLASVASAFVGDFVNASLVLCIVAVSVLVEFIQTRRSERAAEALKAQVAQTATVLRDGRFSEISRRLVVPGDVVKLDAGSMVPADSVVRESKDLHLSEAALTGESLPVEKQLSDSVLMGSSVVSGTGLVVIEKTGTNTAFSEIAKSLAHRAPQSEFERGITRFGAFILKTVVFLVLFVFLVAALMHKDPLQSLLFAVALAVGLTPEFLPMITTVTLTRGAVRMAESKVLVKNLAAIQNFGSIDVLCCDKTGTLTTGEMTLDAWLDPFGAVSERPLLLAYLNSYFESGIDNPMDEALLQKARLNSLDSAVLRHAHPDITGFSKLDEVPFDFERRRVSIVAARGDEAILVTKGAPEHVLEVCTRFEANGEVKPIDEAAHAHAVATFQALSAEGYRVLGVGYGEMARNQACSKTDEHDLILAGFVAFTDPARPDAAEALANLATEGIRVQVLTGDNELVSAQICQRVGVPVEPDKILLGSELDKLSDAALFHEVENIRVFARVSPAQKNRVLCALKARGHVVGFLGDGINDAPCLHAADVGISVSSATDVARDAADIILLEPGLNVLLTGVLEGRRAFGNVMKYLLMGTSSNFGNMFSMAGAAVLLPFLPMLPTQILLNNFLYDLAQISIPSDEVDPEFVKKPRRWDIDLIRRFMLWVGPVSSLYDFLTFFVLLKYFHASEALFHTGWFVESLATQSLVIFVIRTAKNPFTSRPSKGLIATSLGVVALGLVLPLTPMAHALGFVPLPAAYFAFLALATATYMGLVEIVKRIALRDALT
ncbi:MAG TPA: magnesium-translocating P-type ATPase [Polyangiaceae bacterium]|jgi:Mg2+-importing ATPase|nr:magnesium-translocating P-type ATPase [Polyangiaceae bacterium]